MITIGSKQLKKNNPNLIRLSNYNGTDSSLKFKCLKCGYIWTSQDADEIILGYRHCKKCNLIKQSKQALHSTSWLKEKLIPRGILPITKYKGSCKPMTFKCLNNSNHGCWTIQYAGSVIWNGGGCPKCNSSKGEKLTNKYLRRHGFTEINGKNLKSNQFKHTYVIHYRNHPLSLDFMLRINNKLKAIEFDGKQHFKKVNLSGKMSQQEQKKNLYVQQKHDQWKTNWCNDHDVQLIRIKNPNNITSIKKIYKLIVKALNKKL